MSISKGTVDGPLTASDVRRSLKRSSPQLQWCYEKQLAAHPTLAGTLAVKFTISDGGRVSAATAQGLSDDVGSCAIEIIKSVEFPVPASGDVTASYTFTFTSTTPAM